MQIFNIKSKRANQAEVLTSLQDQPFLLDMDVLFQAGITKPGPCDEPTFFQLVHQSNTKQALRMIVSMLERSSKTEHELSMRLKQKGFDDSSIQGALQKAKELHLLDDYDYAMRFVRDRLERKGLGERGIRYELQRKGIPAQAIDQAMSALDPDDYLQRAKEHLPALMRRYANHPARDARNKAAQFLQRKGFDWSTIKDALAHWPQELMDEYD